MIVSKVARLRQYESPSRFCSGRRYVLISFLRCNSGTGLFQIIMLLELLLKRDGSDHTRSFSMVIIMAREFARRFYSSAAWQDCRNEYAKKAHYLCEDCMRRGVYRPGVEVHHIEELTPLNIYRPEITLSFDNLVLLCRDCHKARHMERNRNKRYTFGADGKIIITE